MGYGQKLKKINRIAIYLILLIVLCSIYLLQQREELIAYTLKQSKYPISCDATQPDWLIKLVSLLKSQGYIGVQISYTHQQGTLNCSIGWASLWPLRDLQNNDQFKYASLSKIFTAALVLDLVEKKQLNLDDQLFTTLDLPLVQHSQMMDIQITHLLQHRAGFDRRVSGDLVFEKPNLCPQNLQHLAHYQLDFLPNTQFAYSNFGYCLLGEVIAKKYQTPLKDIYQQQLFQPAKAKISHIADHQGTVEYFDFFKMTSDSLNYPHFTAYGGFVGTAQDFSKVLDFIQQQNYFEAALKFKPNSCRLDQWTGCHSLMMYQYQSLPSQRVYWRDGSLPGLTALTMLFEDGRSIVFLANYRGEDVNEGQRQLRSTIYGLLGDD